MNRIAPLKLARMAVLLIMVCGVLVFGANHPAWATPGAAQGSPTVPITPVNPPEILTLNQIHCSNGNVLVEFMVHNPPSGTTDYGSVSYDVNGQTRTATFDGLTGNNALYVDSIPSSAQSSKSTYDVTSASVTLTASGRQINISLQNPNKFTVVCKQKSKSNADCPELSDGDEVSPDSEAETRYGQWRFRLQVIKCDTGGQFAIGLIGAGGVPAPNAGELFIGSPIDVTFFDSKGSVMSNPNFTGSMTLCADYSAADLALAGGTGNLTIQTYDQTLLKWVALATTAGANSSVCAELPHLSTYALAVRNRAQATPPAAAPAASQPNTQPAVAPAVSNAPQAAGAVPRALPNTSEPSVGLVPFWLWALIGLSIAIACIIFGWGKIRAQSAGKDSPR
jgi:hypothetical protein